ncbi:MAG: zinc ribbon domain-containing protein [Candidatus Krumholzibacteria bacterium]|nr:zinc ribbon domain-containing protein [Candidatus Krumholzibacteria bacterium]
MYCQHCGKEAKEGSVFCENCGKPFEKAPPGAGKLYAYELTRLTVPDDTRNPGVAASLGFFLGWILLGPVGYIYLGQWNWFWLTFVIQIFAIPLTAGVAYILLPVIFAIHQYQMAKELNEMVVTAREKGQGDLDDDMPAIMEE